MKKDTMVRIDDNILNVNPSRAAKKQKALKALLLQ
jgi:hypothetical protein